MTPNAAAPPAAEGTTTVAKTTPATIDAALARSLVDEVVPEVERLRGLEFKRPVPVEVVGDEDVRRHMMDRLEKYGEVYAPGFRIIGWAFGNFGEGFSLGLSSDPRRAAELSDDDLRDNDFPW